MNKIAARLGGVFIWTLFTMGQVSLSAQTGSLLQTKVQGSQPDQASNEPTPQEAVQISEIPDRLLKTATLIRRATRHAEPVGSIGEIEESLPQFRDGARALMEDTRVLLKRPLSPGTTRELKNGWAVIGRRATNWQELLKKRSSSLQEDLNALSSEEESWRLVLESASTQEIPSDLKSEIAGMLKSIQEAERSVLERRNTVLKLQSDLSQLSIDLDETVELLNDSLGMGRDRLLQLDSLPIWKPLPPQKAAVGPENINVESSRSTTEVLKYYILNTLEYAAIEFIAFVILLIALVLLRRKAANYQKDGDELIRAFGFAVRRPFSTAILLTVVGAAVSAGSAPTFLVSLGWYALLIPLVRVVPGLSPPGLKPFLWILTLLYVFFGFFSFLPAYSTYSRLLMLLLILALAICLIFYDHRLARRELRDKWIKVAQAGVRLGIFLAVAAIVGETVGATNLSRYLGRAILNSVYFAAALYGALMVLRGFLQVLLRKLSTRGGILLEMPADLKLTFARGLTWLGIIIYLMLLLKAFEFWDTLLAWGTQVLAYNVVIGALEFTISSAFSFVAVLFAATVLSRVLRFFLTAGLQGRFELHRGKTEVISKLTHYTILTLGFFMALGASGINLNKFTVLAGALGVGVGFGLQNIVNNFVSGLILLFERPLQVGDRITVGDTSGEVKDIGIRASTIATWEGADVIIPNASLISGNVTNWTLTNNRRRGEINVGAAYGTDPQTVLRILRETALAHPNVLREPEPSTLFVGFGDSSLDFCLRYWTLIEHAISANSELHVAVCERFATEGIEIPFPQRDLHVKDMNPAALTAPKREDLN